MASVEMRSIDELFELKFFVPSYQRGYRWTNTQVKELLEDLYDFAVKKTDEKDYYCLQPIIVKSCGEDWELVDGQQRLTALWLVSALYYCSNKDDVVNLERKEYKLTYQEKEVFTELFSTIDELLEDNTLKTLTKNLESHKTKSIDSRNLIQSIEYISSFTRNNKTAKGVLGQIFEAIHDVKVIWYVLGDEEDAITTFTNINANKIELTNAELIKAVLLNSIQLKNDMQNVALQWEEIEKGLNVNEFWNYIIYQNRKKYSTRIDYLFEIFCTKHDLLIDDGENDRYKIFRAINEYMTLNSAEDIWNEVQEIYDTLRDWYNDYFFYHTIGLLIIADKEKDAKIINRLYDSYSSTTKKEFKQNILEQLRNIYFGNKKSMPFQKFDLDQIHADLEEITVQESEKVRSVLLLYNIALLVNAYNTYERFPFELYKNGTWDIEHINPQTPKEASDEEKKNWLLSYKKIISKDYLVKKIDACISQEFYNFDQVSEEIATYMGIIDNDSISNLVLLDASTNRGYKNECFAEKRKKIIEVERTKSNDEKYIPIGTKWVFLKGYDKASQLIVWGPDDMKEYVEDIADKIFEMIGGKSNG